MNRLVILQTLLIIAIVLDECQSIQNQSKKYNGTSVQNVEGKNHWKKSPKSTKSKRLNRNDFGQAQPPFQPISAFYQNQPMIETNSNNNNIFIDPPPPPPSPPIPSLPADFKSALPPLPDFADVLPPPVSDIGKATAPTTTGFGGHHPQQAPPFMAETEHEQTNKASNHVADFAHFAQSAPPLSSLDHAPAHPMPEPSFETTPMLKDPAQPFIFDFSPTQPLVQPVPVTQTVPLDRIVPVPYAVPVVHNVLVPQPFEVIRNVPIPQIIPVLQRVYVDRPVLIEKKVPIKLRPPKYYLKKFYGPPKQLAGGLKRKFKNYYKDKLKPIYRRSRRVKF